MACWNISTRTTRRLLAWFATWFTKKLLKNSFHLEGGKTGIGRRLSWDEPSLTLTCAPAQNQTGRCHPSETRPLTIREYARVQTFPDEWSFAGAIASQYKQIGNAVPINLAEAIGRSLVRLLNDIELNHPLKTKVENKRSNTFMPGIRGSDGYIQGFLLETESLYLINNTPTTLLGTYRKICRDWIINNNLYNFPVSDSELDTAKDLLSVRRLILTRKSDEPLVFKVEGYSLINKKKLSEMGYPVSKKTLASRQYILYTLAPLS